MRSLTLIFSIAFVLFASAAAQAQTGGWDAVRALEQETNIIVEAQPGTELKGKFTSASDNAINFRSDGRMVTLSRTNVSRVYLTKRGSRVKRALWGAAAGGGIGLGVGAAVVAATKGDPLIGAGGFLYGIPAGAAIGALTAGRKRGELIYSAQ